MCARGAFSLVYLLFHVPVKQIKYSCQHFHSFVRSVLHTQCTIMQVLYINPLWTDFLSLVWCKTRLYARPRLNRFQAVALVLERSINRIYDSLRNNYFVLYIFMLCCDFNLFKLLFILLVFKPHTICWMMQFTSVFEVWREHICLKFIFELLYNSMDWMGK